MPLFPDFQRLYLPTTLPTGPLRWLPFRGDDVIVKAANDRLALITDTRDVQEQLVVLAPLAPLVLGNLHGTTYVTCEMPLETPLSPDWKPVTLRNLYGQIPEPEWELAGYASQVLHWQRTSRFCPVCGQPTRPMQKEWMRECTQCGHIRYPQVSPAVLILVHDGAARILLAHKPGWGDRYSILAGFVLPGESLEECVQREVEEEVGARVTDLAYRGSQPWPFPHQLMVGFTARYVSGELRLDEEELDHAAWFDVQELPPLPPSLSLSRQMIDAWALSVEH